MVRALPAALTRADQDDAVQAVIVLGTGDAFSAGADLKTFLSADPPLSQAGLVGGAHLALAVETARSGLPWVRLGIMPMTIMPAVFRTLRRKLGPELMLTGRLMDAPEVLERGFVNAIAPADGLVEAAVRLAREASNTALTIEGSNRPLTIGV